MGILSAFLILIMSVAAVFAVHTKDLIGASLLLGFVSLISAILFYLLQAPDVAMAEASIGAALTTAIFIMAVKKTKRFEDE